MANPTNQMTSFSAHTKVVAAKHTGSVENQEEYAKKFAKPTASTRYTTGQSREDKRGFLKCVDKHRNCIIANLIDLGSVDDLVEFTGVYGIDIYASFRGINHGVRMILNKNLAMIKKFDSSYNPNYIYKLRVAIGVGDVGIVQHYYDILAQIGISTHITPLYRAVLDGKVEVAEWLHTRGNRLMLAELKLCTNLAPEMQEWIDKKTNLMYGNTILDSDIPTLN